MDNNAINVERVSALAGHYNTGHFGASDSNGEPRLPQVLLLHPVRARQSMAAMAAFCV